MQLVRLQKYWKEYPKVFKTTYTLILHIQDQDISSFGNGNNFSATVASFKKGAPGT